MKKNILLIITIISCHLSYSMDSDYNQPYPKRPIYQLPKLIKMHGPNKMFDTLYCLFLEPQKYELSADKSIIFKELKFSKKETLYTIEDALRYSKQFLPEHVTGLILLKIMLERNLNKDINPFFEAKDQTIVHLAVINNSIVTLEAISKCFEDKKEYLQVLFNLKDNNNNTPLYIACKNLDFDMVSSLISESLIYEPLTITGQTSIKSSIKVDTLNENDKTPLIAVIENGIHHPDKIKNLEKIVLMLFYANQSISQDQSSKIIESINNVLETLNKKKDIFETLNKKKEEIQNQKLIDEYTKVKEIIEMTHPSLKGNFL
ncbi:MAG TPA: hypothetical protein VLB80_05310 [Candidatus Babeliales bacterium]|nr:hypothetical protein [Candidatus Babeliales bacterium]